MPELTDLPAAASRATLAQAIELALEQPTLCAAFQVTAAANAERPALRDLGVTGELTWRDYADRVRSIATGFAALGVKPGDVVAIMLTSRSDFHVVDTGLLHAGAVAFSVYFSNPAEQILPLMQNSEARIVVTQPEFVGTLREVRDRTGMPEKIIVIADEPGDGDMTLAEMEALEAPAGWDFDATWQGLTPESLAGIIYTSGTTGVPKGAQWSHGALLANVRAVHGLAPASPEGRVLSYLPMAHLFERWFSHYGSMAFGFTVTSVPDAKQLAAAIGEVRPTRFIAVPRIYEKLALAIQNIGNADHTLRQALEEGMAFAAAELSETERPDPELVSKGEAARATLAPIRDRLGFGSTEYLASASAPARVDILQVFTALGLPIAEIWGMSETAMSLSNPIGRIKIGTVGRPLPGVEAKLAGDGELLVRGPIFSGYRNDPEKTRDAVDEDDWMHSGDIATVDEDGYYKIVDRKKEIIINSAGKNIPPAMVENRIKQQSSVIGQAVALGDKQPYLTAIIVLDEEGLQSFASANGLEGSFEELTRDPAVHAEVERAVQAANATLARIEQVKKYKLLEGASWLPGSDEITMTMKLKRRVINTKYSREIEALYS
jgi:long-subunit acyl-CoA synthetase (AMP-forming)